jgi:choline-glycine betaine transporter
MQEQSGKIDRPVFAIAAGISVAFVLVGVLFQDELASVVGTYSTGC